jgi:hypothetical protein
MSQVACGNGIRLADESESRRWYEEEEEMTQYKEAFNARLLCQIGSHHTTRMMTASSLSALIAANRPSAACASNKNRTRLPGLHLGIERANFHA